MLAHAGTEAVRLVPFSSLLLLAGSLSVYQSSAWRLPLCQDAVFIKQRHRTPKMPPAPGRQAVRKQQVQLDEVVLQIAQAMAAGALLGAGPARIGNMQKGHETGGPGTMRVKILGLASSAACPHRAEWASQH